MGEGNDEAAVGLAAVLVDDGRLGEIEVDGIGEGVLGKVGGRADDFGEFGFVGVEEGDG